MIPNATDAVKKASVKRACDNCRFRKIKCSLSQPCRACVSMGFNCTFFQPQKKRGPTGHRVSQIRQQQHSQLSSKRSQGQISQRPVPDVVPYQQGIVSSQEEVQSGLVTAVPGTAHWHIHRGSESQVQLEIAPPRTAVPIGPSWAATGSSSADCPRSSRVNWNERNDVEYWLPDNLDAQVSVFDFPGSNIYLKTSLPSIIQPELDSLGLPPHHVNPTIALSNLSVMQTGTAQTETLWPSSIVEANMIPWIEVFFDRLHPTLPVLNRSSLFTRILSQEHRQNPQFGAMLLSLCAFSLTQPIEIDERATSSSRADQARSMMNEATKMRSCSDFGEHPTIEAVLTSFFLFGCLVGSNQHNAAWLRLREALDLAASLGLNNSESYRDLSEQEKGYHLRTYLVLSITERAYALQSRRMITFWGRPGFSMRSVHAFIQKATHSMVSGIIVYNEKDAEGMLGLARLMELFDAIDEEVVDCWNQRCSIDSGYCGKFTEEKALSVLEILDRVSESERHEGYDWFERTKSTQSTPNSFQPTITMRESQCADVFITKKWLQNRLWVLCSNHGLLNPMSERHEMSFEYAITIAVDTLRICRSLRLSSMEAHGIGMAEKLYNIAVSAISLASRVRPPFDEQSATSTVSSMSRSGDALSRDFSGRSSSDMTATAMPSTQSLAEDFLVLLNSFRGGNHPFLDRYKVFLNSLHSPGAESSNWNQS